MFIIGKYIIAIMPDGKVWIKHECGEGMQCDLALFEKWLDKFFSENF